MKHVFRRSNFALALLLAASGCSTWSNKTKSTNNKMWPPTEWFKQEYQKPNSMAAIWSPDVLAMPGRPPTRGFGGRVYFYNELSQAIPVDGEIIVHGYLSKPGTRPGSEQVAADKTFAFTQEQLKNHFSPSELGASYSIWIPWDAADGLRQELTLIPTFKSSEGHLVQGEPAKLFLPGRKPEGDQLPSPQVQTVSYRSSSTPTNPGYELPRMSQGLRTTTIEVPTDSALSRTIPVSKNRESYLLNTTQHSKTASTAASTGAVATPSQMPAAQQASQTVLSTSPSPVQTPSIGADTAKTPTLNSLKLKPMRSAIGHRPWHTLGQ